MKNVLFMLLVVARVAFAGVATNSEPALSEIQAAQATTKPQVTTSDHMGLYFDHFYQIWLENIVSHNAWLL